MKTEFVLHEVRTELSYMILMNFVLQYIKIGKGKSKAVPLQAWSGPDCSRRLRFPDFMTTAQEGGKVVSPTHWPHLPPDNPPGTHFC